MQKSDEKRVNLPLISATTPAEIARNGDVFEARCWFCGKKFFDFQRLSIDEEIKSSIMISEKCQRCGNYCTVEL